MSQTEFVPPTQVVANYAENKKKRDEEYQEKHRLIEGEHKGRIIKIGEQLSKPPNNNPMWVMEIRCKGNEGKPVEEKKIFVKHLDFHMAEFYKIIKEAGFKLKEITSEKKLEDVIDVFMEDMPNVEFSCKHQKDSSYNIYEILSIEDIGGHQFSNMKDSYSIAIIEKLTGDKCTDLARMLKIELAGKKDDDKKAELIKHLHPDGEKKKSTSTSSSSASTSEYSIEDIKELDKEECLEVAEEFKIVLKGKTRSKMQTELIEHIHGSEEKKETPKSEPDPEPESKEKPPYSAEDISEMTKDDCLEVAKELSITLKGKVRSKMQKELMELMENWKPSKSDSTEKSEKSESAGASDSQGGDDDDPFPDALD